MSINEMFNHVRADGISALQVQAVHLACARHETFLANGQRAGFYLGDGPGVGKGRQIAALVTENILRKRGNERVSRSWKEISQCLRKRQELACKCLGNAVEMLTAALLDGRCCAYYHGHANTLWLAVVLSWSFNDKILRCTGGVVLCIS